MKKKILTLLACLTALHADYSYTTDDGLFDVTVHTLDCLVKDVYIIEVISTDYTETNNLTRLYMEYKCTKKDIAYANFEKKTKMEEEGCTDDYCPVENPTY